MPLHPDHSRYLPEGKSTVPNKLHIVSRCGHRIGDHIFTRISKAIRRDTQEDRDGIRLSREHAPCRARHLNPKRFDEFSDAAMGSRAESVKHNKGAYMLETLRFLADVIERNEEQDRAPAPQFSCGASFLSESSALRFRRADRARVQCPVR